MLGAMRQFAVIGDRSSAHRASRVYSSRFCNCAHCWVYGERSRWPRYVWGVWAAALLQSCP